MSTATRPPQAGELASPGWSCCDGRGRVLGDWMGWRSGTMLTPDRRSWRPEPRLQKRRRRSKSMQELPCSAAIAPLHDDRQPATAVSLAFSLRSNARSRKLDYMHYTKYPPPNYPTHRT